MNVHEESIGLFATCNMSVCNIVVLSADSAVQGAVPSGAIQARHCGEQPAAVTQLLAAQSAAAIHSAACSPLLAACRGHPGAC